MITREKLEQALINIEKQDDIEEFRNLIPSFYQFNNNKILENYPDLADRIAKAFLSSNKLLVHYIYQSWQLKEITDLFPQYDFQLINKALQYEVILHRIFYNLDSLKEIQDSLPKFADVMIRALISKYSILTKLPQQWNMDFLKGFFKYFPAYCNEFIKNILDDNLTYKIGSIKLENLFDIFIRPEGFIDLIEAIPKEGDEGKELLLNYILNNRHIFERFAKQIYPDFFQRCRHPADLDPCILKKADIIINKFFIYPNLFNMIETEEEFAELKGIISSLKEKNIIPDNSHHNVVLNALTLEDAKAMVSKNYLASISDGSLEKDRQTVDDFITKINSNPNKKDMYFIELISDIATFNYLIKSLEDIEKLAKVFPLEVFQHKYLNIEAFYLNIEDIRNDIIKDLLDIRKNARVLGQALRNTLFGTRATPDIAAKIAVYSSSQPSLLSVAQTTNFAYEHLAKPKKN